MTLVKDQMAAPRVVLRPHATAVARAASSESRPTVSVAALRSPKTAHPVSAPRCAAPRGARKRSRSDDDRSVDVTDVPIAVVHRPTLCREAAKRAMARFRRKAQSSALRRFPGPAAFDGGNIWHSLIVANDHKAGHFHCCCKHLSLASSRCAFLDCDCVQSPTGCDP